MIRPPLPQPVIEALADGSPPVGRDFEEVIVSMAQELTAARQRILELEAEVARAEVTNASLVPDAITTMANVECTRLERDAAQARVKELELACDAHAATADEANDRASVARQRIAELEAERDAAAGEVLVNVADMPPGSTLGKIVIANRLLKHENQNLRERIAELEANPAPTNVRQPRTRDRMVELIGKNATENYLSFPDERTHAVLMASVEQLTAERDAALARVKELESERDRAREDMQSAEERMAGVLDGTFSIGDGTAQRQIERLTAILRAIYPVYRAAMASRDERDQWSALSRAVTKHIHSAVDTARAALTPDLVAALKAAGVEEP